MMELPLDELLRLRRYRLHQFPEVSGKEKETAENIKFMLKKYKPDEQINSLGGYGIAAIYNGKEKGPTTLLRCELDALPITEINDVDYASKREHVGHQCGHDGHMTILIGVASVLHKKRPKKGKVVLLFQPAEENGEGARAVLNAEKFKKIKPDYVFALHNLPGRPLNELILKKGTFTAAVNSMVVTLEGMTSHAGEPDKGKNPALAMAEIITETNKLNYLEFESEDFRQVSYIHMSLGEKAYGVSAGEGEIGLTYRCWTTEKRDRLGAEMSELINKIGKKHKLKVDITYTESFHANLNHDDAVKIIEEMAEEKGFPVSYQSIPHRWGEDFGIFTEKYHGALFGLGAGEDTAALHNPDYDFPDEITESGIKAFAGIVDKLNR